MNKNHKIVFLTLIILVSTILISGCTEPETPKNSLNITKLSVEPKGLGMYDIKVTLMPDKDYPYLELNTIFYENGKVLGAGSGAAIVYDVKKGQPIEINGSVNLPLLAVIPPDEVKIGLFDYTGSLQYNTINAPTDMSSALWNDTIRL